ncbi:MULTISPECIES: hypothetical protein [Streptomyces]|uniref:Uncharacterized protein n=1 Tax=Streptomyces flaveolus TaxID=67297 RepID=A0ABV1VM34_9ACTN
MRPAPCAPHPDDPGATEPGVHVPALPAPEAGGTPRRPAPRPTRATNPHAGPHQEPHPHSPDQPTPRPATAAPRPAPRPTRAKNPHAGPHRRPRAHSPGLSAGRPLPVGPRAGGPWLAVALTVLLAVLLALVPAWPAPGARVAPGGPLPVHSVTAVPRPDNGFHADDGCPSACATQTRLRHDHLGERPSAPDHLAVTAHGTGVVPAAHERRTPTTPGSPSVSPGRTGHDRGRAPPAPPGT